MWIKYKHSDFVSFFIFYDHFEHDSNFSVLDLNPIYLLWDVVGQEINIFLSFI